MASTIAATAVMLILGIAIGCVVARLVRIAPKWVGVCAGIGAVAYLLTHSLCLARSIVAAKVLPVADVLIWSNLQPIAAGVLAGVAWGSLRTPVWQRLVLVVALGGFAVYRTVEPLLGGLPRLQDNFEIGGVVRQTTPSSCSAAASATALRFVGIDTTEAEMAHLCLTRQRGTLSLGTYRGLKLKTDQSPYRVEVFTGALEDFLVLPPAPAVITITMPGERRSLLGAGHSVMLFPTTNPAAMEMGDPFAGKVTIPREQLNDIWMGEALRIVPR